jgi:hypothetical protein
MISRRMALASLAPLGRCLKVAAQGREEAFFRAHAGVVIAPTTVLDSRNRLVHGLGPSDFRLYDNDVRQQIGIDDERMPISLLVALHSTFDARKPLFQFRKAASLFGPLVVGADGEAALITVRDTIELVVPFTSDFEKFTKGVISLVAQGSGCSFIDAIAAASRLLSTRSANHRKVIIIMAEARDSSSKGDLRETLLALQREHITVYALTYSPGLMTLARERPVGP